MAGCGALLAAGTLALQWLDYPRLVRMHSGDVYLFLVAAATRGRYARSSARWDRRGSAKHAVRKPAWAKSGLHTMLGARDLPPSLNYATMYRNCIASGGFMKTATFPSLRVEPALREAAEELLHDGESLSGFVESALRAQIQQRQQQTAFIARGLASRDRAKASGVYFSSGAVLKKLEARLAKAKKASA